MLVLLLLQELLQDLLDLAKVVDVDGVADVVEHDLDLIDVRPHILQASLKDTLVLRPLLLDVDREYAFLVDEPANTRRVVDNIDLIDLRPVLEIEAHEQVIIL